MAKNEKNTQIRNSQKIEEMLLLMIRESNKEIIKKENHLKI